MLDFSWEAVDIGADPDLVRRYWDRVPVVALEGREIIAAPFGPPALRVAIAQALSTRSAD